MRLFFFISFAKECRKGNEASRQIWPVGKKTGLGPDRVGRFPLLNQPMQVEVDKIVRDEGMSGL